MANNVIPFKKPDVIGSDYFKEVKHIDAQFECILIVDHEETRQAIKVALGYEPD